MAQGIENVPSDPQEREEAARRAGWDMSLGPAPFDHGVFVDALEVRSSPPERQSEHAGGGVTPSDIGAIDVNSQMAALRGRVGFREGPSNENPFGPWQGIRNAAWCNSFAQWGAVEGGRFQWPDYCQFGFKGDAYCPYTETHARQLGVWFAAADMPDPPEGAQVLFDWTGWGGADHIGTVWSSDDDYATVWVVEGNTGSPQGVHWVRRDWTYIRGFVVLSDLNTVEPPATPEHHELIPSGTADVMIVALHSSLLLDVVGGSLAGGAEIIQHPAHGAPNQRWRLHRVDTDDQGDILAISNVRSGMVFDVEDGCHDNGTPIKQSPYYGGPNQRFRWEPLGASRWLIRHVDSGKVVSIKDSSTADDAVIHLWEENGLSDQEFASVWANHYWRYDPY